MTIKFPLCPFPPPPLSPANSTLMCAKISVRLTSKTDHSLLQEYGAAKMKSPPKKNDRMAQKLPKGPLNFSRLLARTFVSSALFETE